MFDDSSSSILWSCRLVSKRGAKAGSSFPIPLQGIVIGRSKDCDIVLEDSSVSSRHAKIRLSPEDGAVIADTGSLIGTYVNFNQVEWSRLTHGDVIQIGKFRFVFFVSGALGD